MKKYFLILLLALIGASSAFGQASFVKVVDNIAALKQASVSDTHAGIQVLGTTTKGDGGGGFYYFNAASADAPDDASVVLSNRSSTGRWIRVLDYSGGAGGISDGDKGDVTVSASGTVWNLDTAVEAASAAFLAGQVWIAGGANRTAVASGVGISGSSNEKLGAGSLSAYQGYIDLTEQASMGNPDAGSWRIWQSDDGNVYLRDSAGADTALNGGGAVSDGDKGDITVASSGAAWSIDADSVALGTDTTGNYAAGDAEAGAALTGDTATGFFSIGTLEDARLPSSMADKVFTGSLQVPNGAAPTTDATGELALDTTITDHKSLLQYDGGADEMLVIAIPRANLDTTDGDVIKYDAATDAFVMSPDNNTGSATSLTDIGDSTASGVIAMAGFTNQFTSTLDGGIVHSIYNTDADNTSDTILLDLAFDDSGDANSIFIRARHDIDGTPTTVFQLDALNGAQFGTGNGIIDIGTAGVRLSSDGDGALTILGLGDGTDEDLTLNFDDTANTIVLSSSTGVTAFDFGAIGADYDSATVTLSTVAGAIDAGGATSFELPNGGAPTVNAFGELAGDNDLWAASRGAPVFYDGTAPVALVGVLVSDAPSNGQVPKWNTGGTITWEDDTSGGSATEFDDIGDPSGNGVVALGNTTHAWSSTLDNGVMWEITNTDADAAANTTFLKLSHNDGADANVIYLWMEGDKDGTPTPDHIFSQTGYTTPLPIAALNLDLNGSDSTLERSSAGNLSIEGNVIARQGHTLGGEVSATFESDGSTAVTIADGVTVSGWTMQGTTTLGTLAGALDAGAATSLEIPNGNDPDLTVEGQISYDANHDVLRAYDGAAQVAIGQKTNAIQVTVTLPNDLADSERDAFWIWENVSGMSFIVTGWSAKSDTDDTTLNIEEIDGDGANNSTVDAVEIATNGTGLFYASDTTITAGTIETGHVLVLDFDDTDTPGQVKITIYGYYASDVN